MKKLVVSLLFAMVFALSMGANAYADEMTDEEQALSMIEEANVEIDRIIDEGVQEADELQADYLSSLQKIEELQASIEHGENDAANLTRVSERLTANYDKELDEIITRVYDETLALSQETIAKAAEKGVIAECSWKLVRFADRYEWIDPIRVVGW